MPAFQGDTNIVLIPAKVPSYLTFNLTGKYNLTKNLRILAGVFNLTNERYDSRVFGNGSEPAPRRSAYAGLG